MTGFSSEWDERYQENTHMSIWPWSTLVSFVMRYSNPNVAGFRVLELGCGAGANIPFFANLGIDYYAVEGSESIVTRLHSKFPQLKDNIVCGDFTQTLPEMEFHLIVDRGSLTCNDTLAIRRCLRMCHNRLNSNGMYIGIDWYSTDSDAYREGEQAEDHYTRTNFTDGSLANTGRVHFSSKEHLLELFTDYEIVVLTHQTITEEIPGSGNSFAVWNFVAKK